MNVFRTAYVIERDKIKMLPLELQERMMRILTERAEVLQ